LAHFLTHRDPPYGHVNISMSALLRSKQVAQTRF
jgi:hypothetical protein